MSASLSSGSRNSLKLSWPRFGLKQNKTKQNKVEKLDQLCKKSTRKGKGNYSSSSIKRMEYRNSWHLEHSNDKDLSKLGGLA